MDENWFQIMKKLHSATELWDTTIEAGMEVSASEYKRIMDAVNEIIEISLYKWQG